MVEHEPSTINGVRRATMPFSIVVALGIACNLLFLACWPYGFHHAQGRWARPFGPAPEDLQSSHIKASGVSGSTFKGNIVRNYAGSRFFAGTAAQVTTNKAFSDGPHSTRWAVCTTIFKPSDAIISMVALKGWAVVIVGDEGGAPFNLSAPNVVFLDATAQVQLASYYGYQDFTNLLPWKHFGRKNFGYLYAIAHGAERIWDFDDDNSLRQGLEPAVPGSDVYHVRLDHAACEAFNPYPLMGGPSSKNPLIPASWPRGFPLDLIRKPCEYTLAPGDTTSVAVVQSLAQHDPDVDGIYRLTRGVPFDFDISNKRTVVIPEGTLTPWNAQATLIMKPAFWSMLLPVTVHGRVSDIWRSYVAQRLMWDIGYRVAFVPPMVDQFRSPHNYLADMQAEEHLYYRSGQLVKLLREWCGTTATIAGRFEELVIELYTRNYLELQDVQLAQQWLLALTASGYSFPPLRHAAPDAAAVNKPDLAVMEDASMESERQRLRNNSVKAQPTKQQLLAPNRSTQAWAIVTTTQAPTQAVKKLAALDGWRVVVVADTDTPSNWSWPNVTLLTVAAQKQLGYSIMRHMKWKDAASRKNVGFMFAISQGAQLIYDVGDNNELLQDYVPMLTCSSQGTEITKTATANPCSGLYTMLDASNFSTPAAWNPYPLFGQPWLRPWGLPIPAHEHTHNRICFKRQVARPLIQQSLSNGHPEAEALLQGPSFVEFDRSAFSVVVPHGLLTPYSSGNTVFLKDALWAMLLPVNMSARTSSVLRSYWSQRILWEINGHVAVLPASTSVKAPVCKECLMERNKEVQASMLVDDLTSMQLTTSPLQERIIEVASIMAAKGHWPHAQLALLTAWVDDLLKVGYGFSDVVAAVTSNQAEPTAVAAASDPDPQLWLDDGPLEHSFVFPLQWCLHLDKVAFVNINKLGAYNSIQQIKLLHAAYRPMFRRVHFLANAGPAPSERLNDHIKHGHLFNCYTYYRGVRRLPEFMAYACAAAAMSELHATWSDSRSISPNFLYVNDDVIFSPCALFELNASNIWYSHDLNVTEHMSLHKGWHWHHTWSGKNSLSDDLASVLQNAYGRMAIGAGSTLHGGTRSFQSGQADFFYLPSRFVSGFIEMAGQMRNGFVISEAAVPNILGLLKSSMADVELVGFGMAWKSSRPCLLDSITSVMPMQRGVNYTAVSGCIGDLLEGWPALLAPPRTMFGVHPYKLSDKRVATHWIKWWNARTC